MSKQVQLKTKFKNKGIFIAVPDIVYSNDDLNATDKLVLSLIHGYEYEWNRVATSTIAEYLNLETTTINTSIRKLVFLDLLEQNYYRARKREFKSLLPEDATDAKSLVTTEILFDNDLSPTYKITIGFIIAASLGENNFLDGFNFNDIETLAKELNLSVSSVYRHLAKLYQVKVIERRDFADYLIRPTDSYSKHHQKNQKSKLNYNRQKKLLDDEDHITPEVDAALNRIASRIYSKS